MEREDPAVCGGRELELSNVVFVGETAADHGDEATVIEPAVAVVNVPGGEFFFEDVGFAETQPGLLEETEVPAQEEAVDAANNFVVAVDRLAGDRVRREGVEVVGDCANTGEAATGPPARGAPLKSGLRPGAQWWG